MRILLCVIASLMALPAAWGQDRAEYHFLRVDGKAAFLERVTLNGSPVLSGTLISVSLPIYVDKYLKDGQNKLELEYTSDTTEGLTVVVETRTRGPQKTEVVKFQSAAGETGGKKVTKTIPFLVRLQPPAPPISLTDEDRQAILTLLQTQYAILARRDPAGLRGLYDKAIREEKLIYPEGVEFFKIVLDESLKMFANPQFRMKPFDPAGLEFTIGGQVVRVGRRDRSPVMESDPVEIEDEIILTQNGKEVRQKTKMQSQVSAVNIAFQKYDGRWYLALPFGP